MRNKELRDYELRAWNDMGGSRRGLLYNPAICLG